MDLFKKLVVLAQKTFQINIGALQDIGKLDFWGVTFKLAYRNKKEKEITRFCIQ